MMTILQILGTIIFFLSPLYIYDFYKRFAYRQRMRSENNILEVVHCNQVRHNIDWRLRRSRQKAFGVKEKIWRVSVKQDRVKDFVAFCLEHAKYIDDFTWVNGYYDEVWGRAQYHYYVDGFFADANLAVAWALVGEELGGPLVDVTNESSN